MGRKNRRKPLSRQIIFENNTKYPFLHHPIKHNNESPTTNSQQPIATSHQPIANSQ
jgi:hypothetical protein